MSVKRGLAQQSKATINPLESLRSIGQGQDLSRSNENFPQQSSPENTSRKVANPEFTRLFDAQSYRAGQEQSEQIQRLQESLEAIRNEVQAVRSQNDALSIEMDQIERSTMQSLPDRVGIYHLKYYELMLKYLRNIRTKIGEARTWLIAAQSKKAKRGGAYADRSQKLGSQFTQSMEVQAARSVS